MRVYDETLTVVAIPPAARTNGTVTGTTVDRTQGTNRFRSVYFSILYGALADGEITFSLEDSDNGSSWSSVTSGYYQGTLPAPSDASTDDNSTVDIGYKGRKRYVRMNATTANTPTAAKALVEFTPASTSLDDVFNYADTAAVMKFTPAASGGNDAFDYSTSSTQVFIVSDGTSDSTVTLNADYNNVSGVATAVDACLPATYTVTVSGTEVVVTYATAGTKTISVSGADAAAITGSSGYANTAGRTNRQVFTINNGSATTTVTLSTDCTNLAGVVSAVDALLGATYVVTSDTTKVKIEESTTGAVTYTIGGANATAVTGSAGYVNTAGAAGTGGAWGVVAVLGEAYKRPTH